MRKTPGPSPGQGVRTIPQWRQAALLLAVVWLIGCGGMPSEPANTAAPRAFINRTSVSETVLTQAWSFAQINLTNNPILLNQLTVSTQGSTQVWAQPDARAMGLQPWGITVEEQPEGPQHAIPCSIGLCASYVTFSPDIVVASDYWLKTQPVPVLQYEFENLMLHRLGYDVSKR